MNIIAYFFVGGVSFLANFVVFLLITRMTPSHWVAANLAGFVVGTLVNYILSVTLVFESRIFTRRRPEIVLTGIVSAIGVGLETALIYVGHELVHVDLNLAKLGATGMVFFWNYGARRFLVFGGTKPIASSMVSKRE